MDVNIPVKSNLPNEAVPWGRKVADKVASLDKQVTALEQSAHNTSRISSAQMEVIAGQLAQISEQQTALNSQQVALSNQQVALSNQQALLVTQQNEINQVVNYLANLQTSQAKSTSTVTLYNPAVDNAYVWQSFNSTYDIRFNHVATTGSVKIDVGAFVSAAIIPGATQNVSSGALLYVYAVDPDGDEPSRGSDSLIARWASGYSVYEDPESEDQGVSSASHIFTGLTPGKSYRFETRRRYFTKFAPTPLTPKPQQRLEVARQFLSCTNTTLAG